MTNWHYLKLLYVILKNIIVFELLNIDGKVINLKKSLGLNGTLIMFICNHCPYVKAIIPRLVNTTEELKKKHINTLAIMPNDTENYPEDNFEQMKIFANKNNLIFPYLIDESQEIAKSYGAVCTPDFLDTINMENLIIEEDYLR